jgi:GntR family transcriptional regulator / MocR family aminotransferase
MFPSLRLGYIVVPRSLVRDFIEHRESLDIFSPTLYQLALSDFFSEGHFARHVRRMRSVYQARRDALVTGIRESLDQALSIVNADAGMHLTAWLRPGIDDREVVRRAAPRMASAQRRSRRVTSVPGRAWASCSASVAPTKRRSDAPSGR